MVTICTTRFNTTKLCILPTQCISVVHTVLTGNSGSLPKQLGSVVEICVSCEVRTEFICICVFRTVLTVNSGCFPTPH
jgi:hypothetical protein